MKKFNLIVLIVLASLSLKAQNYKDFYKTFKNEECALSFNVPLGFSFLVSDQDKELKTLLKKGDKVRLMIFDDLSDDLRDRIYTFLPTDTYQTFLRVKDGKSRIKILVKDTESYISEFVLFIRDSKSLVSIGVNGKFSYEDLQALSDSFEHKS